MIYKQLKVPLASVQNIVHTNIWTIQTLNHSGRRQLSLRAERTLAQKVPRQKQRRWWRNWRHEVLICLNPLLREFCIAKMIFQMCFSWHKTPSSYYILDSVPGNKPPITDLRDGEEYAMTGANLFCYTNTIVPTWRQTWTRIQVANMNYTMSNQEMVNFSLCVFKIFSTIIYCLRKCAITAFSRSDWASFSKHVHHFFKLEICSDSCQIKNFYIKSFRYIVHADISALNMLYSSQV